MPHITIEYSANVAERTDIQELVNRVHGEVLATGVAPLDGLRTRAFAAANYRIADGNAAYGYIAMFARLAVGRTPEQRQLVIDAMIAGVEGQLGSAVDGLMLSAEFIEIQPEMRRNVNYVRNRIGT
jgi:5-carboxymethyl-2-hydroxymuconate isomerase